jgi:hypothetical protein
MTDSPLEFRETLDAIASGRLVSLDWAQERPLAVGLQAFRDLDERCGRYSR